MTAWGNIERLPAHWGKFPPTTAENGQQEVYVLLEGDATLGAEQKRKSVRGSVTISPSRARRA